MTERSPAPGGMNPNIRLGDIVARDAPGPDEDVMPVAVEAAHRVNEYFNADPKTGLANERAWKNRLTETVEELKENDELTVYVADLDGFKAVNDKYGHDAGDELLKIVGTAFQSSFKRSSDVVAHGSRGDSGDRESIARLGGDEFSVSTLRKAGDDFVDQKRAGEADDEADQQVIRVNQKLQELIKDTRFAEFPLRLSTGHATHQAGDTADSLFVRADLNMFQAKYAGKIENITPEDKQQLQRIIPYMESLGARVEDWLKQAAGAV